MPSDCGNDKVPEKKKAIEYWSCKMMMLLEKCTEEIMEQLREDDSKGNDRRQALFVRWIQSEQMREWVEGNQSDGTP